MEDEMEIPAVLSFAGLDPTGGAGLQADIEALASMGAHGCPVATALTVQDTRTVHRVMPVALTDIVEQARAVLADIPVAAVKVGLLGSVGAAEAVHSILSDHPELILPLATVVTPNTPEARRLAPEADSLEACAQELLDLGARFVLVTGAHEPGGTRQPSMPGSLRLGAPAPRLSWLRVYPLGGHRRPAGPRPGALQRHRRGPGIHSGGCMRSLAPRPAICLVCSRK